MAFISKEHMPKGMGREHITGQYTMTNGNQYPHHSLIKQKIFELVDELRKLKAEGTIEVQIEHITKRHGLLKWIASIDI